MTLQMDVIAESIDYLVAHYAERPSLEALALRAGYDPVHFQKLFSDKVGISPKRLIQYMTMRHARELLGQGAGMLEAAHGAGLSGGGRLHDLFVTCEAATPGEVGRKGQGLSIRYGWHPTPLGEILIGLTKRGVCWLGFRVDERRDQAMERMQGWWLRADFMEDAAGTAEAAEQVMGIWGTCLPPSGSLSRSTSPPGKGEEISDEFPPPWKGGCREGGDQRGGKTPKLRLHLHGTNFQLQVWRALLRIPGGRTLSYQDIARELGNPKASRAVGGAVGANPVSLLIPCHRVIQASGIVENYGWGSARKKLLLGLESGHS